MPLTEEQQKAAWRRRCWGLIVVAAVVLVAAAAMSGRPGQHGRHGQHGRPGQHSGFHGGPIHPPREPTCGGVACSHSGFHGGPIHPPREPTCGGVACGKHPDGFVGAFGRSPGMQTCFFRDAASPTTFFNRCNYA